MKFTTFMFVAGAGVLLGGLFFAGLLSVRVAIAVIIAYVLSWQFVGSWQSIGDVTDNDADALTKRVFTKSPDAPSNSEPPVLVLMIAEMRRLQDENESLKREIKELRQWVPFQKGANIYWGEN